MKLKKGIGKEFECFVDYITGADLISADVLADISVTIFKERMCRGMTQKDFAKFMGVTQGMISKWESDNYNFTIETLSEICDKLDLSLEVKMDKRINNNEMDKYENINSNVDTGWSICESNVVDLRGLA